MQNQLSMQDQINRSVVFKIAAEMVASTLVESQNNKLLAKNIAELAESILPEYLYFLENGSTRKEKKHIFASQLKNEIMSEDDFIRFAKIRGLSKEFVRKTLGMQISKYAKENNMSLWNVFFLVQSQFEKETNYDI